jgi:RNA polymerase sigma-70 factor (family 1)
MKRQAESIQDIVTPSGFERLYNCYWEKVFGVCLKNTGDRELAESMTQDIFKSVWERRHELIIETSVEHYLVRSAKLKVLEHFRNSAVRKNYADSVKSSETYAVNSTDNDVSYSFLLNDINTLIEKLPGQCRKVFRLSREQGLSNFQIANNLAISERAVEYHISKAIHFLKQNLLSYTKG